MTGPIYVRKRRCRKFLEKLLKFLRARCRGALWTYMKTTHITATVLLTVLTAAACTSTETVSSDAVAPAPAPLAQTANPIRFTDASDAVTLSAPTTDPTAPTAVNPSAPDPSIPTNDVAPAPTPPTPPPTVPDKKAPSPTPPPPGAPIDKVAVPTTPPPPPVNPIDKLSVPGTVPPPAGPFIIAVPVLPTCGYQGTLPGNAQSIETIVADINDDGHDDTITSYYVALVDSAGWRLRTELAFGPTDDIAIEGVGPGVAKILGAIQVDYSVGDPSTWDRELLVQAGSNSSGHNLAVYGLDNGCLFRFQNEMDNDLVLPVHASIGTLSGLHCDAIAGHQFLVQFGADHFQGSLYNAHRQILDRVGNALIPQAPVYSEVNADTQTGWLNQHGELTCGAITL
jgi:hypothetical protein